MKRYFLTACAIAISSLVLAAPRASAAGKTQVYQVPFSGTAVSFCLLEAGIVTPGTLQLSASGDSLETLLPGTVSYFCNAETDASVASPEQQDIGNAPEEITGTLTSSIKNVVKDGITVNVSDTTATILPGANVIAVEMSALDDDGAVLAGNYEFNVPLTIVCD